MILYDATVHADIFVGSPARHRSLRSCRYFTAHSFQLTDLDTLETYREHLHDANGVDGHGDGDDGKRKKCFRKNEWFPFWPQEERAVVDLRECRGVIKTGHIEMCCEVMEWIQLAQSMVQMLTFMHTLANHWLP